MIIVADENIPKVEKRFAHLGSVRTLEGRRIRTADLTGATVLLVRSVTQVDESLLEGTAVRFVGSATIGMDHVDVAYLRKRGITFAFAPGSNARSVAEYVIAAVLAMAMEGETSLEGRTVGIVGFGNIGSRLAPRARALGMDVLVNDPPLQESGSAPVTERFEALDTLLAQSDIVSLHVPLTRTGSNATFHLLDERRLNLLRPGAMLLNTSRGAVLSTEHLVRVLRQRSDIRVVLDVWEDEPHPDAELIRRVVLASPHIAGYSYDGKLAGTEMLHEALMRFLGQSEVPEKVQSTGTLSLHAPDTSDPVTWADTIVRQMYDIRQDDCRMRRLLESGPDKVAELFTQLRKEYPVRREFWNYGLPREEVPDPFVGIARNALEIQIL